MTDSSLIGSIDQGTSSTRFMIFEAQTAKVVAQHQVEVEQLHPHERLVKLHQAMDDAADNPIYVL